MVEDIVGHGRGYQKTRARWMILLIQDMGMYKEAAVGGVFLMGRQPGVQMEKAPSGAESGGVRLRWERPPRLH